jgi:hypothetical protein
LQSVKAAPIAISGRRVFKLRSISVERLVDEDGESALQMGILRGAVAQDGAQAAGGNLLVFDVVRGLMAQAARPSGQQPCPLIGGLVVLIPVIVLGAIGTWVVVCIRSGSNGFVFPRGAFRQSSQRLAAAGLIEVRKYLFDIMVGTQSAKMSLKSKASDSGRGCCTGTGSYTLSGVCP